MRTFLVLLALLCSSCVTVSTCHPLAARRANACPMNDDWRALLARARERGMCEERPRLCCEFDGRWCCDGGDVISCTR